VNGTKWRESAAPPSTKCAEFSKIHHRERKLLQDKTIKGREQFISYYIIVTKERFIYTHIILIHMTHVYEIGEMCKELATSKGVNLSEISTDSLLKATLHIPATFNRDILMPWLLFPASRESEMVALEGGVDNLYFLYAGSKTSGTPDITSEALYIENNDRIIAVVRGLRDDYPIDNYFEIRDRVGTEVLANFFPTESRSAHKHNEVYARVGFDNSNIHLLKPALERLL
jgi:hypothetical protein